MNDEEYLVWCETQNLMSKKFINTDLSFLQTLTSNDNSLVEMLSKYKFSSKMIPSNLDILEISCQKGFGSPILGEMAKNYVGFDKNTDFILHAKKAYIKKNFSFVTKIKKDINFDVIVDLNSFSSLDGIVSWNYSLIKKWLKKDGLFILGIPNKTSRKTHLEDLQNQIYFFIQQHFNYVLKFHSLNHFINSGFSTKADFLFLICLEQKI